MASSAAWFVACAFLFGVYALPGWLEWSCDEVYLPRLIGEDGIYETVGALSTLTASLIFASLFFMVRNADGKPRWTGGRNVLLALLALGLFFVFGEEINWGQRLFGWATPTWLYRVSSGGEMSLHTAQGAWVPAAVSAACTIAALIYLSILPWLRWLSPAAAKWIDALGLPLPSRLVATAHLVLVVIGTQGIGASESGHFWSEQYEAAIQVLFLLFAVDVARQYRDRLPAMAGWRLATTVLVVVVPLAALMISHLMTSNEPHAHFFFIWGKHYLNSDPKRAENLILRSLDYDPYHLGSSSLIARLYQDRKDFRSAKEQLLRAIEHSPNNPMLRLTLAKCCFEQRRSQEAIEQLEVALRLDPTSIEVRKFAMKLYHQLGWHDKAVEHAEYLRQILPANDPLHEDAVFRSLL